ncbi:MAG: diguanylate cyclase [Nitrospirae bacterium]|nr:diguanylate cyclase [Nitrospirota bacterium]
MRILIAEDDPGSRLLLETILLKWGYEVVVTCDGDEALKALQAEDAPSVAILDWIMPVMNGVEVCRRVRKEGKEPYIYIILLTALYPEEDLVTGMEAGADDYITKPFKTNDLRLRLKAVRRIIELQDELIVARESLRVKAAHDQLTGLLNHEEILRILSLEMDRVKREGGKVGIAMADLDHFRNINDTYGHMAGDLVLRKAAERILSTTRSFDSIGRFGGEKFLLVFPGCDEKGVTSLAERLRLSISNNLLETSEEVIPVTVSIGVTSIMGKIIGDMDTVIRAADEALYRAKINGRNRVEPASEK